MEDALYFVNVLSAAALAGGQLFATLIALPGIRRASAEGSLAMHQAILDHKHDPYLKPINLVVPVSGALLLALGDTSVAPVVLTATGLAASIAGLAISMAVNRPLNARIRDLPPAPVSAEYPEMRQRWDRAQYVRTSLNVIALACFLAAALAA